MPTQPYNLTTERNITLGAGYVYFDPEDGSEALTGELYIGDSSGFSFTMSSEKTEIDSSDTPTAETLISIVKKVTRASQMSVRNISDQNLAFFIGGSTATVTQTNTPVTDEVIGAVQQGRYYQLGASTSNPTGVRNVSSVTVEPSGGGTALVVDTDYKLDAAGGRIYIIPGGGIADDDEIQVDYTPASNTRTRVTSGSSPRKGALRFVSDNTAGDNREFYFPRVELSPNGDAALKDRDNPAELPFDISVLTRTGYEQVYIDGQAA
ncbi:MAG: hypothetical protein KDJ24_20015 [Gammaproteobacteria bacterium]|nr:hypothetical protein [Gammaproteobacteria bacterium]